MEASESEAEVLDDVENLHRFLDVAHLRLLGDDQIDVHVSVDEVAVCAAPHRALYTHQAMLLKHTHKNKLKTSTDSHFLNQECTLHQHYE